MVLAAIIAKFDFSHGANLPLRAVGIDLREAFATLRGPGGFQPHESLTRRGLIPADHLALYKRASDLAAFIGSLIITSAIANTAAHQLRSPSTGRDPLVRTQRADLIHRARDHVSGDGCCFLVAFPGPHPWTASAASI